MFGKVNNHPRVKAVLGLLLLGKQPKSNVVAGIMYTEGKKIRLVIQNDQIWPNLKHVIPSLKICHFSNKYMINR